MPPRIVYLILIVAAVLAGGAVFLARSLPGDAVRIVSKGASGTAKIGGAFQLTDHRGRTVSDTDLRGRSLLIFFGYTHCPDVCPMTLLRLTEALELLGADGEAIQPIFITVDPLRDTPDVIADYIANFDPRFIGLTGTRQQIAAVERAFAVYAKAAQDSGTNANYLVDHTALAYLMGPDGAFRAYIAQTPSPSEMADKIREHL